MGSLTNVKPVKVVRLTFYLSFALAISPKKAVNHQRSLISVPNRDRPSTSTPPNR